MKKYAYLAKLEDLLADLPAQEREDALAYYEEYIDAAGKENEAQTIAALGSPEEVAQKILEGEGIAADTPAEQDALAESAAAETAQAAEPATDAEGSAPAAPQPEPAPADTAAPQAPAAPEPPAAFAANEPAPASYTPGVQSGAKGFHPFKNPPKPFSRRGWIIFIAVLAVALLVQLAVLGDFFDDRHEERRETTAVSVPDFPRTDNTAEAVPGTDHGTYEAQIEDSEKTDGAVTYVPPSSADGIVSLYDDTVQEVELHITSANLYISNDSSERVHLEISGLDADKFETSYQTDDGRRKLIVRDGRKVGAGTPAEQTTVTLTLPYEFRDVEAKLVTGNITVDGLSVRDLELETGTGDIEAGALTAGKLDLKTSTGNITVGPITPGTGEHEVDLKTGTGNIEAALDAAQTEYEYEIKAQRGSVLLNNAAMGGSAQSRNGRYELEASAYTGDVSVTFAG